MDEGMRAEVVALAEEVLSTYDEGLLAHDLALSVIRMLASGAVPNGDVSVRRRLTQRIRAAKPL